MHFLDLFGEINLLGDLPSDAKIEKPNLETVTPLEVGLRFRTRPKLVGLILPARLSDSTLNFQEQIIMCQSNPEYFGISYFLDLITLSPFPIPRTIIISKDLENTDLYRRELAELNISKLSYANIRSAPKNPNFKYEHNDEVSEWFNQIIYDGLPFSQK